MRSSRQGILLPSNTAHARRMCYAHSLFFIIFSDTDKKLEKNVKKV